VGVVGAPSSGICKNGPQVRWHKMDS
jgi:hypothetical protein